MYAALLAVSASSLSLLQAQGQALTGESLSPQKTVPFEVAPSGEKAFLLNLRSADYVQIQVEQVQGLAEVTVEGPGGKPGTVHFNDAGKHGVIRTSVVAASEGEYAIRVRSYHKDAAAAGTITASAPMSATDQDRLRIDAEERLATAEWSRHRGDKASWEEALKNYEQAAALAKSLQDAQLWRDALTGKARLLIFRINDYQAARSTAEEAVKIEGNEDLPGEALAWKTLSSAEYYVADYPESIVSARRALDLYRQTDDPYWQGITLGNLAYMYREVGETQEALNAAQQALDLARSMNDWFGVSFNLEALATIHLSRGELEQSFEFYHQALDTMKEHPYPQEEAASWNGLGELSLEVDDLDGAEAAFRSALETARKANDTAGTLRVLSNLGNVALERHQPQKAIRFYKQGLQSARSLQLEREESLLLTGLGSAHAAQRNTKNAFADYRQAIALAERISQKDSEAFTLQKMGDLYGETGRPDQATDAYERAYELWTDESDRAHAATALASLARIEAGAGKLEEARENIEKSLSLIEAERRTLASRELRTSYFASQHAYYDLGISILMQLDRRFPHQGYARKAFEWAEQARARTLLDSLTQADVAGFLSPDLAARRRSNQVQLNAAYERWRELAGDVKATPHAFDQLRKEIEGLLREADELETRARATSTPYAALTGTQTANPIEIQKQILDQGSALLSYWVGEKQSYMWVVGKNVFSAARLPGRTALEQKVRELRQALTARVQFPPGEDIAEQAARLQRADQHTGELAQDLGRVLLPASLQRSGLRTLFVVADGPLFGVPFAALRSPYSDSYLISKMAVLEEPSASAILWLSQSSASTRSKGLSLAIFGDPVYTADDVRLTSKVHKPESAQIKNVTLRWAAESDVAHLPRLAGSRAEGLAIANLDKNAQAVMHTDFDAAVATVEALNWKEYDIAHFAVHALLSSDHPAFSGVVLSMFKADGSPQNGVLRLPDIYALKMPVALVVLSGCRTSEGTLVPGEGLVGLSRAFLIAGARGVVGSLWSVEDQQTSRFMREFYTNLLTRGMAAPEALRQAQLSFSRSPQTAVPYYWAGFSFQGAARGK